MAQETGLHQFEMEDWISCAPFERLLHIEIVAAADGRATLRMPFLLDFAQGAGLMHGGALVSLADTAVVMAIKSILPAQTHFATTDLGAKFLRPVTRGIVTAEAQVVRQEGRTLQGQSIVYDGEQRPVLEFTSTFRIARDSNIRGVSFRDTRVDL